MTTDTKIFLRPHGYVTRTVHWLSVLVIIYGYYKGLESVTQLSEPTLYWSEVRFAVGMGLLFLFRLFWTQKIGGKTRLSQQAPRWEHLASRTVHYGLYGSVFMIVGTGLAIAYAYASPFLGMLVINVLVFLHESALALLKVLIASHICGALWHKFIRKDNVFESMAGQRLSNFMSRANKLRQG